MKLGGRLEHSNEHLWTISQENDAARRGEQGKMYKITRVVSGKYRRTTVLKHQLQTNKEGKTSYY